MFIMGDIFPCWLKFYFSNKRKIGTYFKHLVLKPIIDVIKKEVVQDLLFINRNLLKMFYVINLKKILRCMSYISLS